MYERRFCQGSISSNFWRIKLHWLKRPRVDEIRLDVTDRGSTEISLRNALCVKLRAQGHRGVMEKRKNAMRRLTGCGLDSRHVGQIGQRSAGGEGWGNPDVWSSNWKNVYSDYVQLGTAEWVNQSRRVPFPVHSCKTMTAHLSCFPTNS